MWIRAGLLTAATLGGLVAAGTALGQPAGRDRGLPGGRFWELPRVREELALSEEQIGALKQHHYESRKSIANIRARIQLAEVEMEQLIDVEEPDQQAVAAKANQIGELRAELYRMRVADRLSVKKILNPEQQRKLRDLRLAMRRNRAPGWRPRRPEAPSPDARPNAPGRRQPQESELR